MMSLILKSTYFSANVDLYSVRLFFLFSTGRLKPVKKPKKKKKKRPAWARGTAR